VDPDGRFACWIVPGLCDPVNLAQGYMAVRSVLGEENQKRLDKYAGKAIQGLIAAKANLGAAQQVTDKVIDEVAYLHAGGNTLGDLQASGESAVGKFVARTGFGLVNAAISSPQMAADDLVAAHARVGDAWTVATDSSRSALERVDAGSYILDVFSQDLLMVAGTLEAAGVRGPTLYAPKVLPTEIVYGTEVVSDPSFQMMGAEGPSPGTGIVKYDPQFASEQILGESWETQGGRTIGPHAAARMTTPPRGRAPMTKAEVDAVLDTATKVKKVTPHPEGDTITVQRPDLPGKPQVVVDAATGKRVVTVIKNEP
jgi:hypothetical protein